MTFAGKTAIVTGAASGIGRALARALVERGARVTATDVDREGLAAIEGATTARLDVRDHDAFGALVRSVVEREGTIDYLFNNAGVAVGGEVEDLTDDDWERVIDVNLLGVIHGVRHTYPFMKRQGHGHVVNIASVAGVAPYPLALPYTTTKHAVVGLSLALAAEARAYGVNVTVACPGAIDTAIWERSIVRGAWDRDAVLGKIKRTTSAEDCARAILVGVERRRTVVLVTREAKMMSWLTRLSPGLAVRVAGTLVDRVRVRARTESRAEPAPGARAVSA